MFKRLKMQFIDYLQSKEAAKLRRLLKPWLPDLFSGMPKFKYHRYPVTNGVIESSELTCVCCNERRGYIYTGPVYNIQDFDSEYCPWCIADGEAANSFHAEFSDDKPLLEKGIDKAIIDEVVLRNPGYECWQLDRWLCHCDDACEFHGNALQEELKNVSGATISQWILEHKANEALWHKFTDVADPNPRHRFLKFKCRHCDMLLLSLDQQQE